MIFKKLQTKKNALTENKGQIARKQKEQKAKTLYKEALEQDGGESWSRSKLMLVGEGRAGKTSVLRSLMGKEFRIDERSTIGAETDECIVDTTDVTTTFGTKNSWRELSTREKRKSDLN